MGKRSKKVVIKKMARPRLEKSFSCPSCSHEKAIECRMDRIKQVGTARCKVCSAGYQTVISYLSDPVDVYAEWVDVMAEREKVKPISDANDFPDEDSTSSASNNSHHDSDTDDHDSSASEGSDHAAATVESSKTAIKSRDIIESDESVINDTFDVDSLESDSSEIE